MTTSPALPDAVSTLLQFQAGLPIAGLPTYGAERFAAELELFPTWCVQREFARQWDTAEQAL